jgi:putative Mg2+ transporter-C (MgtC) family protein
MTAWNAFSDYCASWQTGAIAIRLVSALLIGVIVGVDRGIKRRGAGIKTHTLVCLGSALVMLTGQFIFMTTNGSNYIDRLPAQVISGVGFLGVGTIIVTGRNQVRGLTTAASLWTCACLGLAAGIGFVDGAVITLVLVIFTLKVLTKMDEEIHRRSKVFDAYVEFDSNNGASMFFEEVRKLNIRISNFELGKSKIKGEGPNAVATMEVEDAGEKVRLLNDVRNFPFVRYIEEL